MLTAGLYDKIMTLFLLFYLIAHNCSLLNSELSWVLDADETSSPVWVDIEVEGEAVKAADGEVSFIGGGDAQTGITDLI